MPAVLYSAADHIAVVTLNRAEARNAVDREMARGLEAAVDRLEDDPEIWVGVLCADTANQERPVFCVGADLKVIRETGSADVLDTERGGFGGFVYRERTKPIVVAVDGLATAVVSRSSSPPTSSWRPRDRRSGWRRCGATSSPRPAGSSASRAVGRAVAMDAILTGEPIDATRARTSWAW